MNTIINNRHLSLIPFTYYSCAYIRRGDSWHLTGVWFQSWEVWHASQCFERGTRTFRSIARNNYELKGSVAKGSWYRYRWGQFFLLVGADVSVLRDDEKQDVKMGSCWWRQRCQFLGVENWSTTQLMSGENKAAKWRIQLNETITYMQGTRHSHPTSYLIRWGRRLDRKSVV